MGSPPRLYAALAALVLLFSSSHGEADPTPSVTAVPEELRRAWKLDPFYGKHLDLHRFPILASSKVSDRALQEVAWIIRGMLEGRPDVYDALREAKIRCCVMAHDELTTQVPEHRSLEPSKWWDRRARGLGPSKERPCISCAEENLLGLRGDPYAHENILVHEFAHAIDLMGLRKLDATFERRLAACYAAAQKQGLWKGLYAGENKEEYWAEGVQSWFGTNSPPGPIHNHVDTRAELRAYDPRLGALIKGALGDGAWRYVHPRERTGQAHLAGFDPAKAPRFQWPDGLSEWYQAYEKAKKSGAGRVELQPLDPPGGPGRSPTSLEETRILFVNKTAKTVQLFWLDYQGERRPYGSVLAGKSAERSSLVGHQWLAADPKGRALARFRAARTPGRAVVRSLRSRR